MKVVDSTLPIGHARGDADAKTFLESHTHETLVAPAVIVQEFAVGEVFSRDATRETVLGQLGPFDVRPFDADHAYHGAKIEAALRAAGDYESGLRVDILIGGVARSLSVPIVTKNVKHYERLEGVRVEGY